MKDKLWRGWGGRLCRWNRIQGEMCEMIDLGVEVRSLEPVHKLCNNPDMFSLN